MKETFNFKSLENLNNIVFFDLGANIGKISYQVIKNNPRAKIYMFEPVEINCKKIKSLLFQNKKVNSSNITLLQKAAWINNGFLNFKIGKKTNHTNSKILEVLERTPNYTKSKYQEGSIQIECVDIVDFISKNTKKCNFTIVKMDIEGSEFDILNKIRENLSFLDKINILLIETHSFFNKSKISYQEIFNELKQYKGSLKIYTETKPGLYQAF